MSTRKLDVRWANEAFIPRPPRRYVVDKLLLRGSVNMLVGDGGTKKTFLSIDLGVSVCLGEDWLGMKTERGTVLFVDEESGRDRFLERLEYAMRAHGAGEDLPFAFLSLQRLDLRKPEDVAALTAEALAVDASLIVIDALVDIMPGGNEDTSAETHPVFMALRNVAEVTGAAILLLHHANKAGGYRGSTAMKGASDLMLLVESKPDSPNIDISFLKARDVEPFRFAATVHFGADTTVFEFAQHTARSKPVGKSMEYVLRYVTEHGPSLIGEIEAHADMCSGSAARQAVYKLVGMKRLRRVDSGGPGTKATYDLVRELANIWEPTGV